MTAAASSRSSAQSTAAARKPPLVGCEAPRISTPPLRRLTPKTSLGFAAVEFATDVLGMELFPWQRWLLVHMLELLSDGELRFRTVVVLVARQNGKSTLSIVLSLFFMYVLSRSLVIGTAQDLDVAEEIWQGAVDLVEEVPELDALKKRVVKVNGKKSLELVSGERYKVKAANRKAGRGLSGDLVLLDELREHQTWDAWGAVTKTTMARAFALIVALSNAGDASSVVLRYLRKMAHQVLGDPDGVNAADDPELLLEGQVDAEQMAVDDEDTLAIFEWSAPPGCDIWDRRFWPMANPSLGYTITERTIAAAARTDPEWVFRTEVLCQWSDGTLQGPFPAGTWDAGRDPESEVDGDRLVFAVDVSWDRSRAHVGVAGFRADELQHVEIVASRSGTDWVKDWFSEKPSRRAHPVVVQSSAPAGSLIPDLEEVGVSVVDWKGTDVGRGCGQFFDAVKQGTLRHRPQPVLDLAASASVPRLVGDSWVWDRKGSPVDAAPLVAVTAALWGVNSQLEASYDVLESVR